jgi:dTDP-4-dehydrorhamnose 3,5-epimerase
VKITATAIDGVRFLETEPIADDRGDFARSYCTDEFSAAGLDFTPVQMNISRNHARGTLRGLHYQAAPHPDPKIVRCTRGRIFDVAVDLRSDSKTLCQWVSAELSPDNQTALIVPAGCAHGFITLEDNSEVQYLMGARYVPDLARGVRWDDPAFAITWPIAPITMAPRDAAYPDFDGAA